MSNGLPIAASTGGDELATVFGDETGFDHIMGEQTEAKLRRRGGAREHQGFLILQSL